MRRSTVAFETGASAGALAFGHCGKSARVVAAIALLASILALATIAIQVRSSAAAIDAKQRQLVRLRALVPTTKAAVPKDDLSVQQRRTLNQITRQLNTPWSQLLDVLEASLPDEVALVAIEPDGASAKVRLQAEAKALETLIAYASTLRQMPAFAAVNLIKHETNDQDANRPVRLVLEVTLAAPRVDESIARGGSTAR